MQGGSDLSFKEHSNKEIWANPTIKGSANKVHKVIAELKKNDEYVALFRSSAFRHWLEIPPQCGDPLICHGPMLHEIKPKNKTDVQRLFFKVGDYALSYGATEFCLITGFHFGRYPSKKKDYIKRKSTYRERLFPNVSKDSLLAMDDLEGLIFSPRFFDITTEDAVRSSLLYILCQGFLGKDGGDKVTVEWLALVEKLDDWNRFKWGSFLWDRSYKHLSKIYIKIEDHIEAMKQNPKKELKYAVSGFHLPFKIWIWEMFPYMRKKFCLRVNRDIPRLKRWDHIKTMRWVDVLKVLDVAQVGRAPRLKMEVSDEEALSDHYLSYTRYESCDVSPDPYDIQTKHRKQDDSSSSQSDCRRSRTAVWEDHEKRLCKLEELCKTEKGRATNMDSSFFEGMSQLGTEGRGGHNENNEIPDIGDGNVGCKNNEIPDIGDGNVGCKNNERRQDSEETIVKDKPKCGASARLREKSKIFESPYTQGGHNENNEILDIGDGKVGCKNNERHQDSEETIVKDIAKRGPSARLRNKAKILESPYTQLKDTTPPLRQPRKKKGERSPPPPPDHSGLLLQPYVQHGTDMAENLKCGNPKIFQRHRLSAYVMDLNWWELLFGVRRRSWLEAMHINTWVNLLLEKWKEGDRWTIMDSSFFNFLPSTTILQRCNGQAGRPPLWAVDRVYFPINIPDSHWLLGELIVDTLHLNLYDSLVANKSFEKLRGDGKLFHFGTELLFVLDKINYWGMRGVPRVNTPMQICVVGNVPQQKGPRGDCGVFVCMLLEHLVSGIELETERETDLVALEFRGRMASIFWASRNAVV